jgi:hypothetical protein
MHFGLSHCNQIKGSVIQQLTDLKSCGSKYEQEKKSYTCNIVSVFTLLPHGQQILSGFSRLNDASKSEN